MKVKSSHKLSSGVLEGKLSGVATFKHPKIHSDSLLVLADAHIPCMNVALAHRMFEMCDLLNVQDVLVAGDFFDQNMFSKWDPRKPSEWAQEKRVAKYMLKHLTSKFRRVTMIMGNHDLRILKTLGWNEDFRGLVSDLCDAPNLYVSEYPKVEVNDKWLIFHPKSYSQVPGSVARHLAEREQKHVVSTHGHFTSLTFDRSGVHYAIDIGGLPDRSKMEYVNFMETTHPVWVNGFLLLIDNEPLLFTEHTNWTLMRRLYG